MRRHTGPVQLDMFPAPFSISTLPTLPVPAQRTIKRAIGLLDKYLRQPGVVLSTPEQVRNWLRLKLCSLEREVFMVLYLDNQNRFLECETLFTGTINGVTVHVREVVKSALKHNAAAVVLAHNHPSGCAEPSREDRQFTDKLKVILNQVDIRTLDHLVIGSHDIVSFAERGWL